MISSTWPLSVGDTLFELTLTIEGRGVPVGAVGREWEWAWQRATASSNGNRSRRVIAAPVIVI